MSSKAKKRTYVQKLSDEARAFKRFRRDLRWALDSRLFTPSLDKEEKKRLRRLKRELKGFFSSWESLSCYAGISAWRLESFQKQLVKGGTK